MQMQLEELEKAHSIEWQEFILADLFGKATRGRRLKSADRIEGNLPFVTAGEADAGISAYIGNDVNVFPKNTITIDMFGSAKYRGYNYGADDHVAVVHTENLPTLAVQFLAACIHKSSYSGQFDYSRNFYPKDADELKVKLPTVMKDGETCIDFDFMAEFMSTLKAERLATLKAYLTVTGSNDTTLTIEEETAITNLNSMEWKEFRIGDLFDIGTGSLVDIKKATAGRTPRISVQTGNNGILGYYSESLENARYFENFISVNFFGNSYYHPYRASVEMKVHTLIPKQFRLSESFAFFAVTSLNRKLVNKFSYGSQLSSSKLKNDPLTIQLPTLMKDGETCIDFDFMATFVTAMKKVVIKQVVTYLDQHTDAGAILVK